MQKSGKIISAAYSKPYYKPNTDPPLPMSSEFADQRAEIEAIIKQKTFDEIDIPSSSDVLLNPEKLKEHEKPPESIGPWLARKGMLTIVYTRSKKGKSTLVFGECVYSLLYGHSVLWVSFEENDIHMERRIIQYKDTLNDIHTTSDNRIYYVTLDKTITGGEHLLHYISKLKEQKNIDLVVIDSLFSAQSRVSDKSISGYGMNEWIDYVLWYKKNICQKFGVATVLIHHTDKGSKDHMGSDGIRAAADMMVSVARVQQKGGKWVKEVAGAFDDDATIDNFMLNNPIQTIGNLPNTHYNFLRYEGRWFENPGTDQENRRCLEFNTETNTVEERAFPNIMSPVERDLVSLLKNGSMDYHDVLESLPYGKNNVYRVAKQLGIVVPGARQTIWSLPSKFSGSTSSTDSMEDF